MKSGKTDTGAGARPVIQGCRGRSAVSGAWCVAILALLPIAACAPLPQRNDWSTYAGPGADYFRKPEYKLPYFADPLEPANRIAWAINDVLLFDVVEPISAAWRFLVPRDIREPLVRASKNLTYPVRLVNNLLQGNLEGAGTETRRFLINSTVGVLGLFDPAAAQGLRPAPTDLGRTFVHWGWRDSPYLVVPGAGPSSVRDAVGLAGDVWLDPTTYYLPAALITRFIEGSESIESYKRLVRTSYDAYGPARYGWTISRWLETPGWEGAVDTGPAAQTLHVTRLTYHDPWFPARGRTYKVKLKSTGRKFPYDVWLQKKPAPLVFIMPGLGAHRQSRQVLALAEMAYRRGFSAAVFSSAMNFEFMEKAATVWVPGFAPADAHDVHVTLDAVAHDLDARFPDRITAWVYMGMSLGAFHGFYIAAEANEPGSTLIGFDRYVLLDPPVSLRHAADRLDTFYNVPLSFPKAQRDRHTRAILKKAVDTVFNDTITMDTDVSFTKDEAQFLIGLSFRAFLHDIIWSSQRRHDMGVLKTPLDPMRRAAASDEIFDFSFIEYFYAFVLPYYKEHQGEIATAEEMFRRMDARSIAGSLKADGRVRVFTNADDFLVTPEDRQWLIHVFGESHVAVRPTGGHTGALYKPEVQQQIMDTLEDLRPAD